MAGIEGEFLVLEDDITHDDFTRLAKREDWTLHRSSPGDDQKTPFEEVWATPDRGCVVHYVDDPITLTRHLWVRGRRCKDVLVAIDRNLPAFEPDELLEDSLQPEDRDAAVRTLFRIAVAFPNFDDRVRQIFSKYLTHPDPLLRKATLQAIGYRLWPENKELLEHTAQEDPDAEVRQFAAEILRDA